MKTKTLFKVRRTTVKTHVFTGLLFGIHIENETRYKHITFSLGFIAIEFEYKRKVRRTDPEYGVYAVKYTGKY